MDPLAILLLAAGGSTRMRGADKLMQVVDGQPLIARQARAALDTGWPVLVTLPVPGGARAAALAGLDLVCVPVPDAALGMSASIRRGVAALPGGLAGVVIVPADMPEITGTDIAAVGRAFLGDGALRPVRGAADGDPRPGHPAVFPARLFPELRALSGDEGARALLRREEVLRVLLPAQNALTDLDTPEDWAAWRARRETG